MLVDDMDKFRDNIKDTLLYMPLCNSVDTIIIILLFANYKVLTVLPGDRAEKPA